MNRRRLQVAVALRMVLLATLFTYAAPGEALECEPPWTGSECSECPEGTHMEHVSGMLGMFDVADGLELDPAENPLDLSQYRCVADGSCDDIDCSGRGECRVADGVAACECQPGYLGGICEDCSAGYERDASGACVLGDACRQATCSGFGDCVDLGRDLVCDCESGYVGDACETCAVGYHGEGHSCVPDERCVEDSCSGNGECRVQSGVAVCACEPGWEGEDCDVTAGGCPRGSHRTATGRCIEDDICEEDTCSDHGECVLSGGRALCECQGGFYGEDCSLTNPPTLIVSSGTEESLAYGENRYLSATTTGIGDYGDELVWSITEGPGCLRTTAFGDCDATAVGDSVIYESPTEGSQSVPVKLDLSPTCCPEKSISATLNLGNKDIYQIIPHWLFEPLDHAIEDFMSLRCTGAATVGIARNGIPLYHQSYGVTMGSMASGCTSWPWITPLVKKHTPIRIASLSKAVTAAVFRKVVKAHLVAHGKPGTNAELESTKLLDPTLGLLPPVVSSVLSGASPPPAPAATLPPPKSCTDTNPCNGNGNCFAWPDDNNNIVSSCACYSDGNGQPLFAGKRCEIDLNHCPNLDNAADDRWSDITLGHLIRHRAGFYHDHRNPVNDIIPAIPAVRGLTNTQMLLASDVAPANVNAAEPGSVFPAGPNQAEMLLVEASRCLRWNPGSKGSYTNLGFAIQQYIIEYLTGQPLGESTGAPQEHWNSHLGDLLTAELGFTQSQLPDKGFYMAQYSKASQSTAHPGEPWPRGWIGGSNPNYYYQRADRKQPRCLLGNGVCDDWLFDWDFDWNHDTTEVGFDMTTLQAGAWSMATEARAYLRFMKYYYIDGGAYGKDRQNNWSRRGGHGGSLPGARSFASQLGTRAKAWHGCNVAADCCAYDELFDFPGNFNPTPAECQQAVQEKAIACKPTEGNPAVKRCRPADVYTIPYPDANGRINGPWDPKLTYATCHLPDNLDIFFAVNQRTDEHCWAPGGKQCEEDYSLIDDFVYHGLCNVDWSQLP